MDVKKENDLLEETLSLAETDYAQAYRFLLGAYEKEPGDFGPQTQRSAGSERPSKRTAGGTARRCWWTTTLRSWRAVRNLSR